MYACLLYTSDLELDYKNAEQLKKFINDKGKILPRRATGACAKHQRDVYKRQGITYEMGACLATFIFIFYTAASGLFGVVYTDVVQFFMLIIFVYILLPLSGIRYLGGFGNFWSNVPKEMLIPNIEDVYKRQV